MPPPAIAEPPGVSRLQAWGTVALLFVASIVSVLDRTILVVVVDAVKTDLHVSDVQISLLQGLAFGLFYATVGVWLGLVADRRARRNLIVAGIALWSVATIGGGLAVGFRTLFACRMLVGLGEAALGPAAISLIADLFPPGRRGRAIGVYLMGQALAGGLSISITGALLGAAAHGRLAGLPLVGALAPWRMVFVLCGGFGLLVSAALLLTREPPREQHATAAGLGAQAAEALRYLLGARRRYLGLYLGFAVFFLGAYGAGAWQVAAIARRFGISAATVAAGFGPLAIVFGVAGPLIGGAAVDALVRRGGIHAVLYLLAAAPLLALPSALGVLAPGVFGMTLLYAAQSGISAVIGSGALAYLQSSVPPQMRGFSVSLASLVNTLIGASLGPTLVALLTERVFADSAKVGWSILAVSAPACLLAMALFALAAFGGRRPASDRVFAHG